MENGKMHLKKVTGFHLAAELFQKTRSEEENKIFRALVLSCILRLVVFCICGYCFFILLTNRDLPAEGRGRLIAYLIGAFVLVFADQLFLGREWYAYKKEKTGIQEDA